MTANVEKTGVVILAAGLSRRFDGGDKLLAPLLGKPLAAYAAETAAATPADVRLAVIPPDRPALAKVFRSLAIDVIVNDRPADGQGKSLAAGVSELAARGCARVFVLLADMPFIKPRHLKALSAAIGDHDAAIATDGRRRTPPALFTRRLFPDLTAFKGDEGAKSLLRQAASVAEARLDPDVLLDIDTAEALSGAAVGAGRRKNRPPA